MTFLVGRFAHIAKAQPNTLTALLYMGKAME